MGAPAHLSRSAAPCLGGGMEIEFTGELVEWGVYWGVVPVRAWIGGTEFTTAMFPREETWFLPVKFAVRRAEGIELGEIVAVRLCVGR